MTRRAAPAGDFDYEAHERGYAGRRRGDPRIAAHVHRALGAARTVVNVGAGAGSYEPLDRYVMPVEPSAAMRAQRPVGLAPALDATAGALPFDDGAFDAAMASVTIHQWPDLEAGLAELRRVTRGPVVILTVDAEALVDFWLYEYVPEVIELDRRRFPPIARVVAALGGPDDVSVTAIPTPADCADGFGEAFYARPEALLEPEARAAQSGWMLAGRDHVETGMSRLSADLASGRWDDHHGHLRTTTERLGGLRLIVRPHRMVGGRAPG